jgi:hypothetical protein
VRKVLLVAGAAAGLAACGASTPARITLQTSRQVTTTTTGKPAPSPADVAFLQDLVAVDSADKTATASFTTLQANQATGTTYSQAQVLPAIAPVTAALTTALTALTSLIPSLPSNMTLPAQNMSTALSDSLNVYSATDETLPTIPDAAAVNSAETELLISDLQADVTETGTLLTRIEGTYVEAMQADYSDPPS